VKPGDSWAFRSGRIIAHGKRRRLVTRRTRHSARRPPLSPPRRSIPSRSAVRIAPWPARARYGLASATLGDEAGLLTIPPTRHHASGAFPRANRAMDRRASLASNTLSAPEAPAAETRRIETTNAARGRAPVDSAALPVNRAIRPRALPQARVPTSGDAPGLRIRVRCCGSRLWRPCVIARRHASPRCGQSALHRQAPAASLTHLRRGERPSFLRPEPP
jgi:hypothetical protein